MISIRRARPAIAEMAVERIDALADAARTAGRRGIPRFTRFLDPAEAEAARRLARAEGVVCTLWGGYEDAERAIACFHPLDETVDASQFPLVCLHSRILTRYGTLTHRDLLGAFMALGLTRACIGDMIIRDADAYLFATEEMAPYIASALNSAGRVSLSFSILDEIPPMPKPSGTTFQSVVSSLRLDAVLACAYRLSRTEAAECIRSGLVKVDHLPCERVDAPLHEGALLSLRGRGRTRLCSIGGTTRKQRIEITIFRYE